jgi:hypothetical protein
MDEINKPKMPIGMILILILMGWGFVAILLTLRNPVYQLGPLLLTGLEAIVMVLITASVLGVLFFGIIKRYAVARKLAIGWYMFSMILTIVNIVSFITNNTMYDEYYRRTLGPQVLTLMTPQVITASLIISAVFGWTLGIIIIVYLFRKKDFFTN